MTEGGHMPDDVQLEPTIAPVRRPVPAAEPQREAGSWRLIRPVLLGLVGVVTLAGILVVFVYLPDWVQEAESVSVPEPALEPELSVAPDPPLSAEEREALTAEAESLLAQLIEQQRALDLRSAASWGDTSWSSYENAAINADEALLAGDPLTAVNEYRAALEIGAVLMTRSERIISEALAAGEQAILLGDSALATSQFELVLGVDPDNRAARNGLERARTLPQVIAAMNRGDAAAAAGELEPAAAAYREALGLDPGFASARSALTDVNRRIDDARFDRLLHEGFAASEEGRHAQAAEVFAEALGMRPDSSAARDGLVRAEQDMQLDEITMAEVRARAFERRELWDRAIERYSEALATDPTLAFAIEGLERSRLRADLDAKLEVLNSEPIRLLDEAVLADARAILAAAQAVIEPGPRLLEQQELLGQLIELATTPIQVALISDNETEVSVYRVGDLGSFINREIALQPGSYTVIGQRRGYRDVRRTFNLVPGNSPEPVTVICTERI